MLDAFRKRRILQFQNVDYKKVGAQETLGDYWGKPDIDYQENSLEEYCHAVFNRHFHIAFHDFALLSVYAQWEANELLASRIHYQPCPVLLREYEWEALLEGQPLDPVEPNRIVCKSALRFEFDPGAESEKHPASHLHLNDPEVRIAVSRPLNIYGGFKLILDAFYPDLLGSAGNFLGQIKRNEAPTKVGDNQMFVSIQNPKEEKVKRTLRL